MEETKHFPFFPANYVTLQQLKEKRMKEKQQKEEEEERKKQQEREEEQRRMRKEKEVEEEEGRLRKEKEEEEERRLRKKIEEEERRLRKEKEEEERRLRKEKEEEERRLRKEKEEEERRLRKEKEEEEERERLKNEEEKEKKLKEPVKSYEVAGSSNQSKSHGRGWIRARGEKKGLVEHEYREVQGVDKEQTSEEKPRKKRVKQKNRRKTVEDKAATGGSPARLTHDGNQSPIQGPDSSATTESQRQGYRRANFASQADNLSLGFDNTPKSEAKIKSSRRARREKVIVARKLSDLKIIANETGESNGIILETGYSKAIVSEHGVSPEAGNRQKFGDVEVDGDGTTTVGKEIRLRSVAGKRGGWGDRFPRRGSLRGRREKPSDLKIIANETGESSGIVSETGYSKAIVSEHGISPEAGNRQKFGDVEVDGDGTTTVGKEIRLRSVAGERGGWGDRFPRQGSLRDRREKLSDLKIIANETGESNGIVLETGYSKAIVSEHGKSPEAGNMQKFGDVEVDGDGTTTVGKEVRLRSVAGKRGGWGDRYRRRGSLRDRRRENEKSGMWVKKEELSSGDGDRRALDFRGD